MSKKFFVGLCMMSCLALTVACKSEKQMKIHVKGEGRAVQMNDIIQGKMTLSSQDSVLFELNESEKILQVMDPIFAGDLNEGLMKLHEGDSASFYIPVDSINKYMGGGLPEFVKDYLIYSVKIDKLYTLEELQMEEQAMMESKLAEETENIAQYLQENNIKAEPMESGIYIFNRKGGSGKNVPQGSEVSVNYAGRLLNGKLFDTSIESVAKEGGVYNAQRPYEPMSYVAGVGQMIPGFDEAVMNMKKGEKATVIIPFNLAYGAQSMGADIPAYSTLVFDIEVVDIKSQSK